jgi:electron transport complex protein RnfC
VVGAMFFLKTFGLNGIHPEEYKYLTSQKKIESADIPSVAYIPVSQHIGKPAEIVVEIGDKVEEGQLIAKASGFISANIHTSIPGTVKEIKDVFTSLGKKSTVVVIELEGEFKKSGKNIQLTDWRSLSRESLLDMIKDAGIVGLGGATFPTHVKLSIPEGKSVDTLIINGAECEPFITCDHRLMIDKSEDMLEGISILDKILDVKNIYIGIEHNKQDAIRRLKALCSNRYKFKIVPLKVKYPQGDEKQLIKAITGRVVPVEKIPLEVNVVVQNVATVVAIKEAVVNTKPLIDRVVTVSGTGVVEPKNLKVKIGTPISEVLEECGGLKEGVKKVIVGGPMMGFSQMDLTVPVTKGCSAILAFTEEEYQSYEQDAICINCGKCINACAFGLMPTVINRYIKNNEYDEAVERGLLYCKECGACAWTCPARIPLVQTFKHGKDINRKLSTNKQ